MYETDIKPATLPQFAAIFDEICKKPVRGILLNFYGLGYAGMPDQPDRYDVFYAERGIVRVSPYSGPWGWMNDTAVELTDRVVAAVMEKYGLADGVPVVASGGSMGGHAALIYSLYAQKTPAACAADCPVCDLPYHSTERPDLPRTMFTAFRHMPGTLQQAMQARSPLHQAERMPHIPYYIVHGEADADVNKNMHSDRFVAELRKTHGDVTYVEVPGMKHCQMPEETARAYHAFILSAFGLG